MLYSYTYIGWSKIHECVWSLWTCTCVTAYLSATCNWLLTTFTACKRKRKYLCTYVYVCCLELNDILFLLKSLYNLSQLSTSTLNYVTFNASTTPSGIFNKLICKPHHQHMVKSNLQTLLESICGELYNSDNVAIYTLFTIFVHVTSQLDNHSC